MGGPIVWMGSAVDQISDYGAAVYTSSRRYRPSGARAGPSLLPVIRPRARRQSRYRALDPEMPGSEAPVWYD